MSDLNEIRKKVRSLLVAEAEKMRALGATDADVQEDAFIEMVSRKVADETFDDLGTDERKELWRNFLETASPEHLRHMAKNIRAKGEVNFPYRLEHLADLREREGA
jgi:Mg/Co/Ni transporter MgtE